MKNYELEAFLDSTPRLPLIPAPTPLHRLNMFGGRKDVEIWIKRDDLTGIGPGGNKIRPLEFLLGDATSKNADVILAAGPLQSNLCALAASAAARAGLACELYFNAPGPGRMEGNLLLEKLLGAEMHFLGEMNGDERNAVMEKAASDMAENGRRPYVIRNGATSGRGAFGYAAAILEMKKQWEALNQDKTASDNRLTIFAPGGNGGVAAGLIYGNALLGDPFGLVIVSVEDDRKTLAAHIGKTIREAEEISGIQMPEGSWGSVRITDDYMGGGWSVNTPESEAEVPRFAREEGIFIENVYDSKVVVGMRDMIEKGLVSGSACYLHTGGFGSLFAQY